ncbi:hypothetical protein Tco_0965271 [Tanacetum coccineum]
MLSDIEDSHGPSDAMHNPSQPLKVGKTLFQNSQRFTHFYQLSHSELVDIEKVALSSSLRSLKSKCTIEFRAKKRPSINLIRTLVSPMVAAARRRLFRYSDTVRLSRSDEVLKLKNFKKDATLKLFKSTNQESGTESEVQDDNNGSGNDTDADDANIRPIYDEELMAEEKVFAIAALKNDLRKLKGNSIDTKFAKTSVLGKPVLQSLRNQLVVRQPNAVKSERPQMSKPWFASQVDVNNNLSRPLTQHYLPKRRESVFAKPDHMIASSKSRNSSKNMLRFSSNDMVHNHYLDEDKKKTQERDRNSKLV